jgi:predicted GIY-YIG superfamily endonuclease
MYAPPAAGVYGISNAREWVYIGQTDNIRGALLAHLQDQGASLMKREPTGFVFEVCEGTLRSARQHRLILEYGPACNRVQSEQS